MFILHDNSLFNDALFSGGQSSTGSVLSWYKRMITSGVIDITTHVTNASTVASAGNGGSGSGTVSMSELDAEAERLPPGAEGLLTYEKFQGSRTPVTDAQARGAFLGE